MKARLDSFFFAPPLNAASFLLSVRENIIFLECVVLSSYFSPFLTLVLYVFLHILLYV